MVSKRGPIFCVLKRLPPPLRVLRALELKTEDQVYLIKRIRFIEDDPIALITSYLPCAIIPGLTRRDVELSVYKALRKFNFEPVMARDIFRARVADKKNGGSVRLPGKSRRF